MRSSPEARVPSADDARAAGGRRIPDLIVPGLTVLFCGINPGLYSAAAQHHSARPGNRFWPALHVAGFTERLMAPREADQMLGSGYGITSLVRRATATAHEVAPAELVADRRRLDRPVRANRLHWVAVLGIGAYRTAFRDPRAALGPQPNSPIGARVWVLPSPSDANGSYPFVDLVRVLRAFRAAIRSPATI